MSSLVISLSKIAMVELNIVSFAHLARFFWLIVRMNVVGITDKHPPVLHCLAGVTIAKNEGGHTATKIVS